jgi:hypothetical protein
MDQNPWHVLRKIPNPDLSVLKEDTITWLLALPSEVRPHALAKKNPRVANTLAKAWPSPVAFNERLNEYLLSDRGGRQSFSYDVMMDLQALREYFDRSHNSHSPGDDV